MTPLLHVGPGEMKMPHVVVDTAAEAREVIRCGVAVVVPNEDVACEVMRCFGASEELIELRLAQNRAARRWRPGDIPTGTDIEF